MCGLFGCVGVDSEYWIKSARAGEILRERGPDSCSEIIFQGFFLRHSLLRLSGEDSATESTQPVRVSDDKIVAFNGEIYNWKSLANTYKLNVRTDTDCLVEMLKRFSLATVLSRIEGMYAITLVECLDGGQFRVSLARDQLGMKPLFYRVASNNSMAFGSTVPLLVRGDESVDVSALEYFLFRGWYFPGETAYREVRSVLPGEILIWESGHISRTSVGYRQFGFNACLSAEEVRGVFESELRLMIPPPINSDVIIGFSGGNDSSAIASIASRVIHSSRFCLTNVFFEDKCLTRWDESSEAKLVAKKMKLSLSSISLSVKDLRLGFKEYVRAFGMPFGGSMMPYFLSKYANKRGIRVELNGAGGDEAFGNYFRTEFRLFDTFLHPQKDTPFICSTKKCQEFVDRERWYLQLFPTTELDGLALAFSYRLQIPQEFMLTLDHLGGVNSVESRYPFLSERVIDAVRSFQIAKGVRREFVRSENLRGVTGFYEVFPEVEKCVVPNSKGNFGTPISRLLDGFSPNLDLLNDLGLLAPDNSSGSLLANRGNYSLLFRLAQLDEFVALS